MSSSAQALVAKRTLISAIVDAGLCQRHEAQGFSPDEIAQIQNELGLILPAQYKEFLSAIGRGAGQYFRGTDMFGSVIRELNQMAVDHLVENKEPFSLPRTLFVFSMHQGYQFDYFDTAEGIDDAPVYQYVEGRGAPLLTWKSLSEFLLASIHWHASLVHGKGARKS